MFNKIEKFFSLKGVFTVRNLVVIAMMLAFKIVLSQFSLYITPTFKAISFAYLPGAMVAMLYGPVAALIFGFAADTLGFIIHPSGVYFIGYALSEMLSYFIYACCFYRKPVTYTRAVISRIVITITITFGLNFVWNMMLYGSVASKYFTTVRLINNIVQLPFHAALIVFFGKFVRKVELRAFGDRERMV